MDRKRGEETMLKRILARLGCSGVLLLIYLAVAVDAWREFVNTNHDGLANLGLMVVTAPVAIVDMITSSHGGSDLIPDGHGYIGGHALYYVPAVGLTAVLVWCVGRLFDRLFRSALREEDDTK